MEVKGTAFLARKAMLTQEIGEARMLELIRAYEQAHPDFPVSIIATTSIPVLEFIDFNEMIVREVYAGDQTSYWRFGEKSAEWSLTVGPYKHMRASKSVEQFAEIGRFIYQSYFSVGRAETSYDEKNRSVDLRLLDFAREHRHVYFEYAIVGYFEKGLKLVGARTVTHTRILGFSKGDAEVHYRYRLG